MHNPTTGMEKHFITLIIGVLVGFGFAFVYQNLDSYYYDKATSRPLLSKQIENEIESTSREEVSDINQNLYTVPHHYFNSNRSADVNQHGPLGEGYKDENEAQRLAKSVRILCWVMTSPSNHEKKAKHVKNTWGKRCNKLLFMSSSEDPSLPSIALPNVQEGRDYLWAKTKESFKYVYKNHLHEADWFMKADDDTYVILENLRYMVKEMDPEYPIHFGCNFQLPTVQQQYMSGGAGYVVSKGALRKFVEVAITDHMKCRQDHGGNEDVEMGKCMQNSGVVAGDTRDSLGRYKFLPLQTEAHLIPGYIPKTFWFWRYIKYPHKEGLECCSDKVVSFHYISPAQMYLYEYLIYQVKPYGIR